MGLTRTTKNIVHSTLSRAGLYLERRDGRLRLRRRRVWGAGDYVDVVRALAPNPRIVLVLGAFEGAGALHVARAFPSATVYAFEADPATFERMSAQTAAQRNLRPVSAAIGEQSGQVTLFRNTSADTNSLLPADGSLVRPSGDAVTVGAISVDDFCAQNSIGTVDYVHSDLQGYELQMLRGASGMLASGRIRSILIEVCFEAFYHGQSKPEDLWALLGGYGYRFVCTQGMYFEPGEAYPRSGNFIFTAGARH